MCSFAYLLNNDSVTAWENLTTLFHTVTGTILHFTYLFKVIQNWLHGFSNYSSDLFCWKCFVLVLSLQLSILTLYIRLASVSFWIHTKSTYHTSYTHSISFTIYIFKKLTTQRLTWSIFYKRRKRYLHLDIDSGMPRTSCISSAPISCNNSGTSFWYTVKLVHKLQQNKCHHANTT